MNERLIGPKDGNGVIAIPSLDVPTQPISPKPKQPLHSDKNYATQWITLNNIHELEFSVFRDKITIQPRGFSEDSSWKLYIPLDQLPELIQKLGGRV